MGATALGGEVCPDSKYEEDLRALRALTPAVTAATPDRASLVSFFKALPPDFACFNRLFGYDNSPAPLYYEPQLDPLFPQIASVVAPTDYVRKLVGLSINARWEADQTDALQRAAWSALYGETQLFIKCLGRLTADSEESVWEFLFGGPHPSNQPLSPDVQKHICKASARSCEMSQRVYTRAVSQEHNE